MNLTYIIKTMIKCVSGLLFAVVSGCSGDVDPSTAGQAVYFEAGYSNWAWGRQVSGMLIDADGRVRTYNNPVKWNFPNEKRILTEEQMQENLSYTTISEITIDKEDLLSRINISKMVSNSSLAEPESRGADMGAMSYTAYRYDTKNARYTAVLLQQDGDWRIQNKNPFAKILVSWLGEIRQELK